MGLELEEKKGAWLMVMNMVNQMLEWMEWRGRMG